jgi:glycine/D-amino acid oxidase-like deaminating enzyme
MIVGREDHKTGNIVDRQGAHDIQERFKRLERWTKERFRIEDITCRWSGQIMEPIDSFAFIGHNPGGNTNNSNNNNNNNIYIATGDSGNGITHGTIAGILLSDLILGKNNKWSALYDPSREVKEEKEITRGSS